MRRKIKRSTLVLTAILLLAVLQAYPCSWARGYFYQVTALRGKVVGAKIGPMQYIRWLRQSFTRRSVTLSLYRYRWPITRREDMPLVKTTSTDSAGSFDFGPLQSGHYTMILDDGEWGHSDWFDVEVKDLPHKTKSITIDISPTFPDCKGGHEFIASSD